MANLRLFEILKRAFGKPNVKRLLDLHHLREYLSHACSHPVVICLDLFSYDLTAVTDVVGGIRDDFPKAVFTLCLDKDEHLQRRAELPADWAGRFDHYFKLYYEPDDVEYEPIVRASLRGAQSEAIYNMGGTPIRLTPAAKRGIVSNASEEPDLKHTVFLSYSRRDWDGLVRNLVTELAQSAHKSHDNLQPGATKGNEEYVSKVFHRIPDLSKAATRWRFLCESA